ncbi:hypothetical protein GCM10010193_66020 [Kitasatospora atroaurantiaca]
MDDEPVKAKAMNLPAAIARFADSAATSALVPPSVLMLGFGPSDGPVVRPSLSLPIAHSIPRSGQA